jgi:hypothetical protein
MRVSNLGLPRNWGYFAGVKVNEGDSGGPNRSSNRQRKSPTEPPRFARRIGNRFRDRPPFGQRKGNNRAALGTRAKMTNHEFALVRGQRLLNKGADLIRVWMVPELK